jgi:tetratricopeptide (TPR) repeat protein
MNKLLTTIFLVIFSLAMYAQDKITDELKNLCDNEQYDKIIKNFTSKTEGYSAKSLYYVGLAYYFKGDDKNCIRFMDQSIDKDSLNPAPFYIKASTLNNLEKFDDAIKYFQTSIHLNSKSAVAYDGLGDSYYNLKKYELALECYKNSTEQNNPPDNSFYMIAKIYFDLKDYNKSLEAFYTAKSRFSKTSDYYVNTLFYIGQFESVNGNYDKAELIFIELLQTAPNDYESCEKLIQIYYFKKEYDKAKPFKDKLYEAHKNGLLQDNLEDKFCFDQFKWKDKLIKAYERFEEGSNEFYIKHLFYVLNQERDIELCIQTEYSPAILRLSGKKYILCLSEDNSHSTYDIGFNDDFNYDDLKKSVINILEGKVNPTATSLMPR